jgi:hypothetical protein
MILADPGAAPRYCLILDRSNSGVRLRTTSDFQASSEFFLRCKDTESKYEVVCVVARHLARWSPIKNARTAVGIVVAARLQRQINDRGNS